MRIPGWRRVYGHKLPVILGHDLSGTVLEAPPGSRFAAGDAVYARPHERRIGTLADQIAVREDELAKKPANLSHEEAASIPLVGLTAWQALVERAQLRPGQKVMITAGAGGFGTFAIQLAKALGARVATTCSERSAALVRSLGADEIVDYKKQEFEQVVRDLDVVLDGRCGTEPFTNLDYLLRSARVIRAGGVLVSLNGPPDRKMANDMGFGLIARAFLWLRSVELRRACREHKVEYRPVFVQPSGAQLAEIAKMLEAKRIRPVIDRIFPFEQATEALDYQGSGHAQGKIIVRIAEG